MDRHEGERRLAAHLRSWLGAWPPRPGEVIVAPTDHRAAPGWDGAMHEVSGVLRPDGGAVVSVPPRFADAVRALGDLEGIEAGIADVFGRPGAVFGRGVFRWSWDPAPSDDPGVWISTDDPRTSDWLRPFNGDVLVAFVDDEIAAGVGRKQHDEHGHELAVVTEEGHRGRGWAQRLVTQAARRVIADGAVPVYLHAPSNVASARTADASGFPDEGWKVLGLFGG